MDMNELTPERVQEADPEKLAMVNKDTAFQHARLFGESYLL
jgi:hypothetical protein